MRTRVLTGLAGGLLLLTGVGTATADDVGPVVSHDVEPGEVVTSLPHTVNGTATDVDGVDAVYYHVRDRSTGAWLQTDGSFNDNYDKQLIVDTTGGQVTWSVDLQLPDGEFGFGVVGFDDLGNRTSDGQWRWFEVSASQPPPPDHGYLTIQFGRSQWAEAHACEIDQRAYTLGDVASFLDQYGYTATGTVAMGEMDNDDPQSARGCPWDNQITASWDDLEALRDMYGWTFIGDSQGIYNDDGVNLISRPRFSQISDDEKYRQSCGSLQILLDRGFEDAWGLYAFPRNDGTDQDMLDIVGTCYAFGRVFSGFPNTAESVTAPPWWANTQSLNGGHCNDPGQPCWDEHREQPGWNPNNRRYVDRQTLLQQISAGPGQWKILQLYRLVEGQRLPSAGELDDDHYWDCTAEDPLLHWTSQGELYCAEDFRWVIDNLPENLQVTNAATIADLWGRGNPNP